MTLWHTQTVEAVLRELNVDTAHGLSDDEVARRRVQYGSNELIERGLTVAIGSETGLSPLSECSLVVAPVMVGSGRAATLAVLGPTRMNYSDTLSAVDTVSRQLTRALSEGE